MKLKNFLSALIFSAISLNSINAAGFAEIFPAWILDIDGAFPRDKYIAELGSGRKPEYAKTNAAKEIARYLETNIQTVTEADVQMMEKDGEVFKTRTIDTKTVVSSNVTLSGLRYTVPFNSKKEKIYYCVCFLERETAFNQYLPEVNTAKETFKLYLNNAEKESDPLKKIKLLNQTDQKAGELYEKLCFAQLLVPEAAKSFKETYRQIGKIPLLIQEEENKLSVTINVENDYSNLVKNEFAAAFKECGFTVKNDGTYKLNVTVEMNESGSDPIAVYPGVKADFTGADGQGLLEYGYTTEEKTVSFDMGTAQKKAIPKILPAIHSGFVNDFKAFIEK